MTTTTSQATCLYCGNVFPTQLLANAHFKSVHSADRAEFIRIRMERFGY